MSESLLEMVRDVQAIKAAQPYVTSAEAWRYLKENDRARALVEEVSKTVGSNPACLTEKKAVWLVSVATILARAKVFLALLQVLETEDVFDYSHYEYLIFHEFDHPHIRNFVPGRVRFQLDSTECLRIISSSIERGNLSLREALAAVVHSNVFRHEDTPDALLTIDEVASLLVSHLREWCETTPKLDWIDPKSTSHEIFRSELSWYRDYLEKDIQLWLEHLESAPWESPKVDTILSAFELFKRAASDGGIKQLEIRRLIMLRFAIEHGCTSCGDLEVEVVPSPFMSSDIEEQEGVWDPRAQYSMFLWNIFREVRTWISAQLRN